MKILIIIIVCLYKSMTNYVRLDTPHFVLWLTADEINVKQSKTISV
jgi:hypothetical protein